MIDAFIDVVGMMQELNASERERHKEARERETVEEVVKKVRKERRP